MSHPRSAPAARAAFPSIDLALLAAAVAARCPTHAARRDLGVATGLGYHTLARAAERRPLAAEPFLGLCAALGLDPATLASAAPNMPPYRGLVLWHMAGAAVSVVRHLNSQDQRAAAAAACGLSAATFNRAEAGRAASAVTLLRLAGFVGVHCHAWTAARDPRDGRVAHAHFTGNAS